MQSFGKFSKKMASVLFLFIILKMMKNITRVLSRLLILHKEKPNLALNTQYTHAQINRNWLWKLISPLSVINPIKILDQIKALENRKRMKPSRKTLVKSFRSSEVSKRTTAKWDGENSTSHNPHYRVQLFIFRCVHASL